MAVGQCWNVSNSGKDMTLWLVEEGLKMKSTQRFNEESYWRTVPIFGLISHIRDEV